MKKIHLILLILPFIVSCNDIETESNSTIASFTSSVTSADESVSSDDFSASTEATSEEETDPGKELLDNIDIKKDEEATHSLTQHSLNCYYYTLCNKTASYDLETTEELDTTKYENQVFYSNQVIDRKETNKLAEYESNHEYEVMLWVNSDHELYSSTVTLVDGEVQNTEIAKAMTSEQMEVAEANGSGFDDITALGLNRDAKSYYDSLKNEETFSMNFNSESGELDFSVYQELLFVNDAGISTEYGDDITVHVYSNYHAVYDKEKASFISSEFTVKKTIDINPVTGEDLDETFTYYYEESKAWDISFASQGQYSGLLQEENQ